MDKAKDKKKLPAAPASAKAKAPAPPGKAADDRARLGAILRPDPAVAGPAAAGLKVGSAADKAETEADKVAEAVAAPETAPEPAKPAAAKDQKDDAEPAPYPLGARAPPVPALARNIHPCAPPRPRPAGRMASRSSINVHPATPGAALLRHLPRPPARDGPIRRLVADNGNQPDTDSLSAVPALAPNLARSASPPRKRPTSTTCRPTTSANCPRAGRASC